MHNGNYIIYAFEWFLATMGFSYHTSVYSKSGATNYDKCMSEISGYQSLDVDTRNVTIGNLVATGGESS